MMQQHYANHFNDELIRERMDGLNNANVQDWYVALPEDKSALQREIRFCMSYCQANKLVQTAKWLGELLVTVQVPQRKQ